AQLKIANNLIKQNDYSGAELLLKSLSLDYDNAQIYLDLGDILRMKNRPQEAVKYYERAIDKTKDKDSLWVLYYALGVSYDQNKQWEKAEKSLKKSLRLSNEHYLVLNYLGYSWIRQGENIDDAFTMIVKAYNQASEDPNINDSVGWALYNMGYYTMAVPYLEKAAEYSPNNAVICDHLGDVYWFAQRKNEARFQWQHALILKDDTGELDADNVRKKLKEGLSEEPNLVYNKEIIEQQIRSLSANKRQTILTNINRR
ncbi:MAG: tetratricopeptide repeat protein, partial [Alphaproteobacteria bacterium]|nr:tetratricopeptide repeat protein [Alphaproteobacteria bacterium]